MSLRSLAARRPALGGWYWLAAGAGIFLTGELHGNHAAPSLLTGLSFMWFSHPFRQSALTLSLAERQRVHLEPFIARDAKAKDVFLLTVQIKPDQFGVSAEISHLLEQLGWEMIEGAKANTGDSGSVVHFRIRREHGPLWNSRSTLIKRLKKLVVPVDPDYRKEPRARIQTRIPLSRHPHAVGDLLRLFQELRVGIEYWDNATGLPETDGKHIFILNVPILPGHSEPPSPKDFRKALLDHAKQTKNPAIASPDGLETLTADISEATAKKLQTILEAEIKKFPILLEELAPFFPDGFNTQLTEAEDAAWDPIVIADFEKALLAAKIFHGTDEDLGIENQPKVSIQTRKRPDGRYFYYGHPVAVTYLLVALARVRDAIILMTFLLHDVPEDGPENLAKAKYPDVRPLPISELDMFRQDILRYLKETFTTYSGLLINYLNLVDKNLRHNKIEEVLKRGLDGLLLGILADHLHSLRSIHFVKGNFAIKAIAKEVHMNFDLFRMVATSSSFVRFGPHQGEMRQGAYQRFLRAYLRELIFQSSTIVNLAVYYDEKKRPKRDSLYVPTKKDADLLRQLNREELRKIKDFLLWWDMHPRDIPIQELVSAYGDRAGVMAKNFRDKLKELARRLEEFPDQSHAYHETSTQPTSVPGQPAQMHRDWIRSFELEFQVYQRYLEANA